MIHFPNVEEPKYHFVLERSTLQRETLSSDHKRHAELIIIRRYVRKKINLGGISVVYILLYNGKERWCDIKEGIRSASHDNNSDHE